MDPHIYTYLETQDLTETRPGNPDLTELPPRGRDPLSIPVGAQGIGLWPLDAQEGPLEQGSEGNA